MNHAYRLVWSELSASPVAVPETASGRGKSRGCRLARGLAGAWVTGLLTYGAHAQNLSPTQLPGQAQVSAGTVVMDRSAQSLVVKQSSEKAILNWNNFDIGRDASVSFVQPGATSVALNRVQGGVASQIEGRLSANGQVFLVNPSGVVFGKGSQVNVGGLVASSLDLAPEDFLADRWRFSGQQQAGSVINQGTVQANGGLIALIAPNVTNAGNLQADRGQVVLAAGQKVSFNVAGSGLLKVNVEQGAVDALVENKGFIRADGGNVLLTAKGANALLSGVVNNEGVIRAHTLQEREGRIVLLGDMEHGSVVVAGKLDASAPQGGKGGFIETSAAQVIVKPDASVSTLAAHGQHGTWLIDPVDFNIASDGNISGAQLGAQLEGGNVTILNTSGTSGTAGNVNVQEAVNWGSATTLTLDAQLNVNLNANISADSGHLTINATTGGLSGSGAMNFGGTQQTLTINQGGDSAYSGTISGTGTTLAKTGAGRLTLSGASTYSGGTTVSGGTLAAGASTNETMTLGPLGTSGVTVASGATLDLAGQRLGNALNLSGHGLAEAGALVNSSTDTAIAGGAVTLGADSTVGTTGTGSLSFTSTIDGHYALLVKSAADITFNANVGGITPLNSLTTDSGGRTLLGANVTTTGTQTYADAATISGGDRSLSTSNSQITFGNTVNSEVNQNWGLSLSVGTSEVRFDGVVGGSQGLGAVAITGALDLNASITSAASLSVSATSALDGNVTTQGTQSYAGAVTLGSGNRVLTGDEIDWGSNFGGTGALTLRPFTTSRQMILGAGTPVGTGLNIDAAELGLLTDGFTSITLGNTTGLGGSRRKGSRSLKIR